ncbi:hypothetical protein CIPAW_07G000500 [Carya illinoinensis]|uniref:Uncharacterized protein n=1 Tax=Carya illinoinensis TaxID=32201 RepID=A0A8T1PZY9_CARIL|nr:hypothetical protein CIPAW_07G000500 [Carya illinoinensis]
MCNMAYNNLGNGRRSCHGNRGFRLNTKRFSVQRFRARRNSININNSGVGSNSTMSLVLKVPNMGRADCRLRSFGRSNSFYAEAIADCLEFIKR